MSDDDVWFGWGTETPAHPYAPFSGGVHQRGRQPGPLSWEGTGCLPHPDSPAGRQVSAAEVEKTHEDHRVSAAVEGVRRTEDISILTRLARELLGPKCFSAGVAFGLLKSAVDDALDLLELIRLFVLADMYDRVYGERGWRPQVGAAMWLPMHDTALDAGAWLAVSAGLIEREELEAAHREVKALMEDLRRVLSDPVTYLGKLPEQLARRFGDMWKRYEAHVKDGALESQFKAGVIIGELLFEVLTIVIGIATAAGIAAKLATKAPHLLKAARRLLKQHRSSRPVNPPKTAPAKPPGPATHPKTTRIPVRQRLKAVDDGALHNKEWDSIDVDDFEAKREGLDHRNLSPEDDRAMIQLQESGYDIEEAKRVLNSGHSFEPHQFKRGDKLYAFDSADYVGKDAASPYWLDQNAYDDVAKLHKHGNHWDRQGVKNTLALPCFNKADGLVQAQVAEDHVGVRSIVGKATETVTYTAADGTVVPQALGLPGGGQQLSPGLGQVVPVTP